MADVKLRWMHRKEIVDSHLVYFTHDSPGWEGVEDSYYEYVYEKVKDLEYSIDGINWYVVEDFYEEDYHEKV